MIHLKSTLWLTLMEFLQGIQMGRLLWTSNQSSTSLPHWCGHFVGALATPATTASDGARFSNLRSDRSENVYSDTDGVCKQDVVFIFRLIVRVLSLPHDPPKKHWLQTSWCSPKGEHRQDYSFRLRTFPEVLGGCRYHCLCCGC